MSYCLIKHLLHILFIIFIYIDSLNIIKFISFNSDNFESILISLTKWSGIGCKTDAEIESVLNSHYIDIAMTSAFLNFNDFDSLVHPYLQDVNYIGLISNMCQITQYGVRINELFSNDNLIIGSQWETKKTQFYIINRIQQLTSNFALEQNNYFKVYITLEQEIDKHYITVYSFIDMLGFVGGIFELLKAFGFILANFFARRSLYSSIIPQLYHIKSEEYSNQNESNKHYKSHIKKSWNSSLSYQCKL